MADIQDSSNHIANYWLSVMEIIEGLFLNIDSLRSKDWGNIQRFASTDDALDDDQW